MSAKLFSRDFAQGKVKHLRRPTHIGRQPLALTLTLQLPAPRNTVAQALARRATSSGAGKHIRSTGALRRAENVALKKAIKTIDN